MAPVADSPTFDHKKVTVIYVLGGPGAGKLVLQESLRIGCSGAALIIRQGYAMR